MTKQWLHEADRAAQMKFSTKEDIDAPIAAVWDMITEIDAFERAAMRRGAEVHRLSQRTDAEVGLSWKTRFLFRGKERDVDVVLETLDRPHLLAVVFGSQNLNGVLRVELMSLSPRRTRMTVTTEVKPLNLTARLLVQSMKVARASLTKQYKLRIAEYCKGMEERFDAYGKMV